jgi:hypothetical protein
MEQDFSDDLKIIELSQHFESNYFKYPSKLQNEKKFDHTKTSNKDGTIKKENNSILNSNITTNVLSPPSAILAAAGINAAGMLGTGYAFGNNLINKSPECERNIIKPLDFCYSDLVNNKFCMIDAINLCVTVIAYATHANRAYQMLVVLDAIVPQYMEYLQNETEALESIETAKKEYDHIHKIGLALKTMINTVDVVTRNFYTRTDVLNNSYKSSNACSNRSPSILPDEDSIR